MSVFQNTLETGLADGTTVDITNSDDNGAGNAFASAAHGGASVLAYSTDQVKRGALSCEFTTVTSQLTNLRYNYTASDSASIRLYVYLTAGFTVATEFIHYRTSAAASVFQLQIQTTNRLRLVDSAGATVLTFTNEVPTNQWVRIEYAITRSTGAWQASQYVGDSLTPDETHSGTGATMGATDSARVYFGKANNGSLVTTFYMDDIYLESAVFKEFGPSTLSVTSPATTATADAPTPVVTGAATVTAVAATATGDAPVPVVTGGSGGVTVNAVVATSTADAPAPAVTAAVTVLAVTASATTDAPAPAVTGAANVLAVVATGTADAPAPVVAGGGSATVNAPTAAATADAIAPTVTAAAMINAPAATSVGVAYSPGVTGGALLTAVVATGTAYATAPTVTAAARILAPVAELVAQAYAPQLSAAVHIAAPVATATGMAWPPLVNAQLRDITVTGALGSRRWSAALSGRTHTGAVAARRWEGNL